MNNSNYLSKLDYYKTHPREIDSYAEELVDILCKHCKHNATRREELLQNMKLTLSGLVIPRMFYVK